MAVSFRVKIGRPGRYSQWHAILKNYIDPETGEQWRRREISTLDETSAKRVAEREIGNAQEIVVILWQQDYGWADTFQVLSKRGVWREVTPRKRNRQD